MSRKRASDLDRHAASLTQWLDEEELSFKEARERLARAGCAVSTAALKDWWALRRAHEWQEKLLDQIGWAARQCQEVESRLTKHPAPELETLIKVHRVLILKFSQEANISPEVVALVKDLMKPVMDWARLEEERRKRELTETKYRDKVEAEKAQQTREASGEGKALQQPTLEHIEEQLNLF